MLEINNNDLTKHEGVNVYLKNCPTARVTLQGKVESVYTDKLSLSIKTDKTDATFDINDVVSVVFGSHNATAV